MFPPTQIIGIILDIFCKLLYYILTKKQKESQTLSTEMHKAAHPPPHFHKVLSLFEVDMVLHFFPELTQKVLLVRV